MLLGSDFLLQHSVSSDPAVDPEFDPRCLEQEIGSSSVDTLVRSVDNKFIDLHCMTEIVKFARRLGNMPSLKEIFGAWQTTVYILKSS